jgi:hypothetical protein
MKKIRFIPLALSLLIFIPSYGQKDNSLNRQEKKEGWQLLFNGKNLKGWKFHPDTAGMERYGGLIVEDGIIVGAGNPKGYLYTGKSYSHYVLSYDWSFDRPAGLKDESEFRGNSGCLVHIGEKNVLGVWPLSIEVQGMNRRAGLILPIPRSIKCERTYDTDAYGKAIHPVGQWNTTRVEVNGGEMRIFLNGIGVSTVSDCELSSGPIGLQSEGAPIRWKNIKIMEK